MHTCEDVSHVDLCFSVFDTQGLALSRLYARNWGGDIQLLNLEGVGCDVLVHLPIESAHAPQCKARYPDVACLDPEQSNQ
jgi:hypothetical protein